MTLDEIQERYEYYWKYPEYRNFEAMLRSYKDIFPKLLDIAIAAKNAFPGMLCDDSSFQEGAPLDGCKCCILDKALKDLEAL